MASHERVDPKKKKVLLVGRGAPETGGIAAFLAGLHGAHHPDYETEFLNLTQSDDMGDGGSFSGRNFTRTLADVRAVWRAASGVDLVHIHSALAPSSTLARAGLLAAAARSRRVPVVIHAHGGRLVSFAQNARNRRLIRLCLRSTTHLIAVARGVTQVLEEELGESRVTFVPNGVDTDRFMPGPTEGGSRPPRVLYVGHLSERKGVLDLLTASQLLHSDGLVHELVLVGGRPDEGDEEYRRIEAEIEKQAGPVRIVGSIEYEDMPAEYTDADIFCLPSWWEAMPLSILEAMASGKPVVATDVGDVSQLVVHGRTGLVIEPKSPDSLRDALASLLNDAAMRNAMGTAGRERAVEEFSSVTTHRRVCNVYERLL
jgi:glycosyltransferase involved in cell wall biosynthesis